MGGNAGVLIFFDEFENRTIQLFGRLDRMPVVMLVFSYCTDSCYTLTRIINQYPI